MWSRSVCMTAGVFAAPPSVGPLQFRSPPNSAGSSCETTSRLSKARGLRQAGALGVGLCSLFWTLAVLRAADDRVLSATDVDRRPNQIGRDLDERNGPRGFSQAADVAGRNVPETAIRRRFRRLKPAECGVGRVIPDLQFRDIDGVAHRVAEFKSWRATVIAVTSTSCPLSKRCLPTLARLEKQYAKDVRFVFVDPTPTDGDETIREAIQTNGLKGPYVLDPDGTFLAPLGAKSTTDCFVIDKALTLRHRGAVDDQYGFGYTLAQPEQSLLADALDAVLHGRAPEIAATDAPGCSLGLRQRVPSGSQGAMNASLTYHNRISRIIQANCVECHRPGGAAPFSLMHPNDVMAHAAMISEVVKNGTMPPWFAAPPPRGTASKWANDRSLTAADKSDLDDWLNGDRRSGDPADAPVAVAYSDAWQIGEPDAVVQLPTPVAVPAEGVMPYQHIIVPTNFDEDKWVRGVELRPTARDVVHHVGVFVESGPQPEEKGNEAENSGAYLALYVPGNSCRLFPAGCAMPLPRGARLRFQIHYTPNGAATQDQTQLALVFAKERPQYEVHVTGIVNHAIKIPPKESRHRESGWLRLRSDIQILSFLPHLHLRGKAFRYEAISKGGVSTTLLDIPRYDFNWQLAYYLAEPLSLRKGTKLRVTGWYDNSPENPANPDPTSTVYWGQQTYDEMLVGYIEYIVPGEHLTPKAR